MPLGPPPDHPQATTVLVLGIIGLMVCQLTAPFALVMGARARREITAAGGSLGGSQQVTVGWICGIVGSVLLAVGVLVFVVWLVVVVAVVA